MKLNRTLSLCLTLVLCAGLAIGGTLAFYTDSAEVKNTFNLTEGVDITLTEAEVEKKGDKWEVTDKRTEVGNTYDGIYPGAHMPKDPTVTLKENSDDAYVRVKVTATNGMNWLGLYADGDNKFTNPGTEEIFHNLTGGTLGKGWELADIAINMPDVVYTLVYNVRLSANQSSTPAFTEIVLDADINGEDLATRLGKSFEVNVVAEAIQAASFDSAKDAFANNDGIAWKADTTWYNASAASFELTTADQLAGLAQLVNAGTNFQDKTITLGADIDLHNLDWTPIGIAANDNGGFGGTFDGQGHVISNLYVKGNTGVGLFGYVFRNGMPAVVKNVKVENATVAGNHYVGVIAGHSYGSITGCTVSNAVVTCDTEIIGGKADNGDKAGAIVGFTPSDGSPSQQVTGNTAKNVTISAARDAGQIAGISAATITHTNTIENVVVKDNGQLVGQNVRNEEIGRLY